MNDWLINILTYHDNEPLLFTQLYFWIFLGLVMLVYSFIYKHNTWRNAYLFVVSLFFYYKSGGYFFSLLILSTLIDYTAGLMIASTRKKFKRRLWLIISLVMNLGLLAYFKYAYFFTDLVNQLFDTHWEVNNVLAQYTNSWFGTSFDVSTIILPVGISFYTFQTMSYTIDVYRRKLKPVKNIVDFGFYVTFFPQLVAGPIVRASEFIPQLFQKYQLTKAEFSYAVFLILNGLIKKMLISDYISVNFVDRVFDNPSAFSGVENLLAVYGYAIQIYCDFSGYTDIAIGVALLLGFRLPVNFNSPYKATNITDFWRRWHISLSSWLRDYLYISLGGNRKGRVRQNINLMLTMLLGGLWHGAHLRFIIWGGIHGLSLMLHKGFMQMKWAIPTQRWWGRLISVFITFNLVCLTWIFFRASDMQNIGIMFKQIFTSFHASILVDFTKAYPTVIFLMMLAYGVHWLPAWFKEWYRGVFIKTPLWLKMIIVILVILVLYQAKSSNIQPFIYFQF
ncbi:MAG: MBOAT family protein [Bacteroidales bacterium]|nr:MBOAT family protein [Bacteroidales bacterium]